MAPMRRVPAGGLTLTGASLVRRRKLVVNAHKRLCITHCCKSRKYLNMTFSIRNEYFVASHTESQLLELARHKIS
jgi:hypothetical protein